MVWKRVKRIKIRTLRWLSRVGTRSECAAGLLVGNAGTKTWDGYRSGLSAVSEELDLVPFNISGCLPIECNGEGFARAA